MMIKNKLHFTLIELIVSIAVFLLLLVMMLQFLAGTQQIWKGTSGRGDVFVESKAALDLVSSLFRQAYQVNFENDKDKPKETLFRIVRSNQKDTAYFVGRSANAYGTEPSLNEMYVFRIALDDNRNLTILGVPAIYKNASGAFAVSGEYQNAIDENDLDSICTSLDGNSNQQTIIKRVTGLEFIPGYWSTATPKTIVWVSSPATKNGIPAAMLIQLKMLDQANYELYKALPPGSQADFLSQNELSFSRIIYFDNRDYTME